MISPEGVILGIIIIIFIYLAYKGAYYTVVREGLTSDDKNCLNLGPGWTWGWGSVPDTGAGDGWQGGKCPSTSCYNPAGYKDKNTTAPAWTCMARKGPGDSYAATGTENIYSCSNLPGSGWLSGGSGMIASHGQYTGAGNGWGVRDGATKVSDTFGTYPCPPSSCFNPAGYKGLFDGKVISAPTWKCMLPKKPPNAKCSSYKCKTGTYIVSPDKTCASTTCTADDGCCADEAQCSSHTCALKSHILDPQTYCANSDCTDDKCCTSNPICSLFKDCPSGTHVGPSQYTCDAATCTPKECCISNPKCSSVTDCDAGTHVANPEKVCSETTCTTDECCSTNPTCSSFTTCGHGKHVMSPSSVCQSNPCTEEECCTSNPKCASLSCDKKHTPRNPNKICIDTACTSDECCIPNPTCSSFTCGSGYTGKTGLDDITCIGIPCNIDDCCIPNQRCSSIIGCHSGQSLKKNASQHVCKGLDCTNKECCGDNPKCSTHTCESTYYTIKTLISNAADVTCGGPKCRDAECCVLKPSGRMPKIQTWPIY